MITYVEVSGTLTLPSGAPAAHAPVTFTLSEAIENGDAVVTPTPLTAITDSTGFFSLRVPAVDDQHTTPQDAFYTVECDVAGVSAPVVVSSVTPMQRLSGALLLGKAQAGITIEDENGDPLPQRPSLQFARNVQSVDDPTNDRTVIAANVVTDVNGGGPAVLDTTTAHSGQVLAYDSGSGTFKPADTTATITSGITFINEAPNYVFADETGKPSVVQVAIAGASFNGGTYALLSGAPITVNGDDNTRFDIGEFTVYDAEAKTYSVGSSLERPVPLITVADAVTAYVVILHHPDNGFSELEINLSEGIPPEVLLENGHTPVALLAITGPFTGQTTPLVLETDSPSGLPSTVYVDTPPYGLPNLNISDVGGWKSADTYLVAVNGTPLGDALPQEIAPGTSASITVPVPANGTVQVTLTGSVTVSGTQFS